MARGRGSKAVAVVTAWVFVVAGCGGGGGDGAQAGSGAGPGASGDPETTRAALRDYESAAQDVVSGMDDVVQGIADLDTALTAQDDAAVDAALDAQTSQLDAVDDALERLKDAENAVGTGAFGDEPNVVRQGLAFLPVLLTAAGLASFIQYLRGKNAEANDARMRRDMAQQGIDDGTPGAIDAYNAAQNDLNKTGQDVIQRTTTEVVTQLVLSPVEPTSTAGILVKEAAGQALQEGLTVLTSTPECASKPPASGCRIGTTRTDGSGVAQAPGGKVTISISGNGIARQELDDIELTPGEVIEVWIDLVDIEDVGSDMGSAGAGAGNGAGEAGRGGADDGAGAGRGGGSGGGSGSGGGGTSAGHCSHPDAVGTVVPVSVDIESQADVDALAGCTSVGGIEITSSATGVTSLAGLESLTEIVMVDDPVLGGRDMFSGRFEVWLGGGPDLVDLSALKNLTRVEGGVLIDIPNVQEIDLSSLVEVGSADASLPELSLGGDQVRLIDLSSLQRVIGDLHFTAKNLDTLLLPNLVSLEADRTGSTGGFILSDADSLAILELPKLVSIADQFWVYDSDGITQVQAPSLTSVGDRIAFDNDTKLTSVGLDTITSPVTSISVFQSAVESIGLNGIPSVVKDAQGGYGNVSIEYNGSLTSIGFASLTSIAGSLETCCNNDAFPPEMWQMLRDRVSIGGP